MRPLLVAAGHEESFALPLLQTEAEPIPSRAPSANEGAKGCGATCMTRTLHGSTQAACPWCGERQSYDEARPSKPILGPKRWEYDRRMRRTRQVRDTSWHTHCRACGERIIWSVPFGAITLGGEFVKSQEVPSWVKP
jgi:predicted RNA-binding Zn-ribbon protein involved in translation (DUF1610 family)